MDSMSNPFAPNAGSHPPELVGREELLEEARVLVGRTQLRRSAQSLMITGLRGVGKTVVLNEIVGRIEQFGKAIPVYVEASENRTLGEMLSMPLKMALLKLNRVAGAKDKMMRSLAALRNFMGTLKISYGDLGIELDPCPGVADSGDMLFDLQELLKAVAEAAADRGQAVILLIDEMQYLSEKELEALVMALHRMQQLQLPLVLVGAGLPILAKLVGEAKSYAERLFIYPRIGALNQAQSTQALSVPFAEASIRIDDDAARLVYEESRGYPYFLQAWGSQLWNFVEREPITVEDVKKVREAVWYVLDENFFHVRMERLTAGEREFLRAMSQVVDEKGEGRIAEIANAMGVKVSAIAPRRTSLIKKGMIYSSSLGRVSFTVPLFAEYLKRTAAK